MAGGKGSRTVSKCACAITASRSGFGMPLRFVLPSAASANIVSTSDSNCSAGRTSQTKWATSSPAFQNLCGVPAGTVTRWPGPATSFCRPIRNPTVPRSTWKRSSWLGCTWAAATKPFGCTYVSMTTASPPVSLDVFRKTMRSPVTGFSIVSPAAIISTSSVWAAGFGRAARRCAREVRPGCLRLAWGRLKRMSRLRFCVLGPVQVLSEGSPLPLGAPKQRALLAFLLLRRGRSSHGRAWSTSSGEPTRRTAVAGLQVYVHGLRRVLGADRIETHGGGYRLRVEPGRARSRPVRAARRGRSAGVRGRRA